MEISFRKSADIDDAFKEAEYDKERESQERAWWKKDGISSDGGFYLLEDYFYDVPELANFDGLVAVDVTRQENGDPWVEIDADETILRWTKLDEEEGAVGRSRPATQDERDKVIIYLGEDKGFMKIIEDKAVEAIKQAEQDRW